MPIETPRAKYQQLADQLRIAIERGDYPAGSTLPPETEIGTRYNLDRYTVNRAIRILRTEGLVHASKRRGTIVRELDVMTRDAAKRFRIREQGGARGAYEAELAENNLESHVDRPDVAPAPAPDDIAGIFGLDTGTPVLTRTRKMYAKKPDDPTLYPIQLATSWIPQDLAEGTPIEQIDTGPGGTYSRLAELGHGPVEFTETVELRVPDDDERAWLQMDAEQRVYRIRRKAREASGRTVEVTDTVLPAHQWRLVYTWTA